MLHICSIGLSTGTNTVPEKKLTKAKGRILLLFLAELLANA